MHLITENQKKKKKKQNLTEMKVEMDNSTIHMLGL